MSEPIAVKDALRLIEMALEDESRAHVGPWTQSWAESKTTPENAAFIVLSRATMRPLLECIDEQIRVSYKTDEELPEGHYLYPALAALKAHYDRVRPDWRTK